MNGEGIRAWPSKRNLDLEVSSPKNIDEPFRYKESTQFIMADLPLQRDSYESILQKVKVC